MNVSTSLLASLVSIIILSGLLVLVQGQMPVGREWVA